MKEMKIYTVRALSNIHCGVGQGVGDIDLPTAKESVTGFPFIPGSSIKGVLRDYFKQKTQDTDEKFLAAFGPEPEDRESEFAGAISFTDATLLCLPVRSYAGTFAYMTSPFVLRRLKEELKHVWAENTQNLPSVPDFQNNEEILVTENSLIAANDFVLLEDLEFQIARESEAQSWADFLAGLILDQSEEDWKPHFIKRFAIVSDDIFSYLCETTLPVSARIRMNQKTGIVIEGALWYEESIPAETLLVGIAGAYDSFSKKSRTTASDFIKTFATENLSIQIGGKATTGMGISRLSFH